MIGKGVEAGTKAAEVATKVKDTLKTISDATNVANSAAQAGLAAKDGNWAGFTTSLAGGAGASLNMGGVQKAIGMGAETASFVSEGVRQGAEMAKGFLPTGATNGGSSAGATTSSTTSNTDVDTTEPTMSKEDQQAKLAELKQKKGWNK